MVNLAVAFLFLSIANAAVSPTSLDSDISIIIHNDLMGELSPPC